MPSVLRTAKQVTHFLKTCGCKVGQMVCLLTIFLALTLPINIDFISLFFVVSLGKKTVQNWKVFRAYALHFVAVLNLTQNLSSVLEQGNGGGGKFVRVFVLFVHGRDSVICIATRNGLNESGVRTPVGRDFPRSSRPIPRTTQPVVH